MKRYYSMIKLFIDLIIFGFALAFEGASPERTTLLVLLFAGFVAWGQIRPRLKKGHALWYAVDAALIFLLEYQSKYLVNYFFHILYISTIVEAGIDLDRKKGTFAAAILSIAALSKYMFSMGFNINASTLSQLLFSLFALAFLITLINFGKLQQEERDKSQLLYKELVEAYHRLEELSIQKERAAALEERNRIARDMHDSLGHRLTSLIMQIEMGKEYLKKEPDNAEQYLGRCANNAREALTDTRRALRALGGMGSKESSSATVGTGSVTGGAGGRDSGRMDGVMGGLRSDTARTNSGESEIGNCAETTESIIDMIEEFSKNTGIKINYKLPGQSIKTGAGLGTRTSRGQRQDVGSGQGAGPEPDLGPETELGPQENNVLYRIIQESITNATRHGKATRIDIEAGRDGDGVWFRIQDNGVGGDYTEGFGLSSMRKRLEEMGGSLNIETKEGFKLTGGFKTGGDK